MSSNLENLVAEFSRALLAKLRESEKKYGYQDDWMRRGWEDTLRKHLREHVEKGDPRDVAAYCAFAWHHGWSLANDPDNGHKIRISDSSHYDEICVNCGASDRPGSAALERPCPVAHAREDR